MLAPEGAGGRLEELVVHDPGIPDIVRVGDDGADAHREITRLQQVENHGRGTVGIGGDHREPLSAVNPDVGHRTGGGQRLGDVSDVVGPSSRPTVVQGVDGEHGSTIQPWMSTLST